MRMQSHFTICLLFISLLSACQPTTSISNEAIVGTYNVTLTQEQMYANGATFRNANEFNGTWQLEFGEDGVVRLFQETQYRVRFAKEDPTPFPQMKLFLALTLCHILCKIWCH